MLYVCCMFLSYATRYMERSEKEQHVSKKKKIFAVTLTTVTKFCSDFLCKCTLLKSYYGYGLILSSFQSINE